MDSSSVEFVIRALLRGLVALGVVLFLLGCALGWLVHHFF